MRFSNYIILSLLPLGASAQTQSGEFHPGATAEGVNYALPKTAIVADVTARRVVYTPGEYAKFADRFLHITNVKQESETFWVVDNIKVRPEGVPDTTKYYTVKLKDKTIAPLVQITESGILLAVNASQAVPKVEIPVPQQTSHRLDARKYLTEDILAASSTAKMAELTAQEILDIRDSKNTIKRGQAESMPKDGASLKIVLDELNVQEEALMQLFTGYTDTLTITQSFAYVPSSDTDRDIMFRFSKWLGFVEKDNLAGEPYYIGIKDKHTVTLPTEKDIQKRKIQGIVYNMPSIAEVRLFNMHEVLYQHDIPVAQFGTIDMLAPALFNKGATTRVTFYPHTGGIFHVEN